jgi:hypothetical protein
LNDIDREGCRGQENISLAPRQWGEGGGEGFN